MIKTKKHKLVFENEFNFDLIGICSHFQDYRLVWSLNNAFNFQLTKAKENFSISRKQDVFYYFPYYHSIIEDKHLEIYLIKNKFEGQFLIQEKQQIDYFLFLCNNFVIDKEYCVNKLRDIESILIAYSFDPTTLPSAENILI